MKLIRAYLGVWMELLWVGSYSGKKEGVMGNLPLCWLNIKVRCHKVIISSSGIIWNCSTGDWGASKLGMSWKVVYSSGSLPMLCKIHGWV